MILCVNGFIHIDQVDDFYQESFLSLVYRNIPSRWDIRHSPICCMSSDPGANLSGCLNSP
jgi:hypothetical protein